MNESINQFLRFCIAGSIGFLVDASVLYLAVYLVGLDPFTGRIVSYLAAATTTWKLNRAYTFTLNTQRRAHREWVHYLVINAFGGIVNYVVYALSLLYLSVTREYLVIGVAAGSVAGLIFNFTLSKWWIFKTPDNGDLVSEKSRGMD